MNARTIVVMALALVFGGSAATGVLLLRNKSDQAKAAPPAAKVVVAQVAIPRGTSLKAELLTTANWPVNLTPSGAVTNIEEAEGRVLLTPLVPGEPLLQGKIGDVGIGAATLVRPGMRAYTIHTPTLSAGVAGFVLPGNKVDILLTVTKDPDDRSGGAITTTLLQNVEVLAADHRLGQADNKVEGKQSLKSVTLLVTPDMAAKLSLAQAAGTLSLTLRNDSDDQPAVTEAVTMRQLRTQTDFASGAEGSDEAEPTTSPVRATPTHTRAPLVIRTLRGTTVGHIYVTMN